MISIIIPTREIKRKKNFKHLLKPISSLPDLIEDLMEIKKNSGLDLETIVVGNGRDDSKLLDYFETSYRDGKITKYCLNNLNAGVARAWNMGRHLAEGDFLLYLNDDVRIKASAIVHMINLLQSDEKWGMVGPKGARWVAGKHERYVGTEIMEEASAISGFCFMMRTSLFDAVGGFDNQYTPAGLEEIDMAFAVRKLGKKCIVLPHLEVITEPAHGISALKTTINYFHSKITTEELAHKNKQYFDKKWGEKLKIALINKFLNHYTTARYFAEVFDTFGVSYALFHPEDQRKIPAEFDLYFYVDDGTEYVIYPNPKVKKILYLIDTHMGIKEDLSMIQFADYIFCAQKNAVNYIRRFNSRVRWLPLACSFKVHSSPHGKMKEKIYDVAFVGGVTPGRRGEILQAVKQRYPQSYIGPASREDIGKIYGKSKIVFNVAINNDINMRLFEGLCSGSMVLTDKIYDNGFEELFEQGRETRPCLVSYDVEKAFREPESLFAIIDYFLSSRNRHERELIAERGKEVAFQHRYEVRWEEIMKCLESEEWSSQTIENFLPSKKIFYYQTKFHLWGRKACKKLKIQGEKIC